MFQFMNHCQLITSNVKAESEFDGSLGCTWQLKQNSEYVLKLNKILCGSMVTKQR